MSGPWGRKLTSGTSPLSEHLLRPQALVPSAERPPPLRQPRSRPNPRPYGYVSRKTHRETGLSLPTGGGIVQSHSPVHLPLLLVESFIM